MKCGIDFFLQQNYYIIRVSERDVRKNTQGVAEFIADVLKYLNLLKKYNLFDKIKSEKFEYSPLVFGNEEILSKFKEEERKPVSDIWENFDYIFAP